MPVPDSPSSRVPAPAYRPSPQRASTLSSPGYPYLKSRATSQPPAADRLPNPASPNPASQPVSGRGSPGQQGSLGGIGNGGSEFGVIGGSRTPQRMGANLAVGGGTANRASSFSGVGSDHVPRPGFGQLSRTLSSHIEEHPSRSTSPYPTFSPSSSPTGSPSALPARHSHSPPRADNVSRSRSQSLATGARPDRAHLAAFSTLDPTTDAFRMDARNGESNMSPFSGMRAEPAPGVGASDPASARVGRFGNPDYGARPWASPTESALSSSIHRALGGTQPVVGGFDDANGGRSGSSSRRHSVSGGIGGPGARRFGFELGNGMTPFDLSSRNVGFGARGLGQLGLADEDLLPRFDNALNLSGDRGLVNHVGGGPGVIGSNGALGMNGMGGANGVSNGHARGMPHVNGRTNSYSAAPGFNPLGAGDYPPPGYGAPDARAASIFGTPTRGRAEMPDVARERGLSGESQSSRFSLDPLAGSPVTMGRGRGMATVPPTLFDVGPIGSPPSRASGYLPYPPSLGRPAPPPFSPAAAGPPPGSPSFRPPGGYFGAPARPPYPGYGYQPFSPSLPPPPPPGQGSPTTPLLDLYGYGWGQVFPNANTSPTLFADMKLNELGKGVHLASLPPNKPLYIVAFKAGRRDVFYAHDPTLLISNGDWVVVEGDRGSDMGTVICDQLVAADIREWQEQQATATLLSGAPQHQPPGMAVPGNTPSGAHANRGQGITQSGPWAGSDLGVLLSGVGPTGPQMEMSSGIGGKGPLAKEVMPKRIFAKSEQGLTEKAMADKLAAEHDALITCRNNAARLGLQMRIVDAEYQWDRRKLTFYFKADKRVDFRELTKENFRIFKSRIWMSMVPKDDPRQ